MFRRFLTFFFCKSSLFIDPRQEIRGVRPVISGRGWITGVTDLIVEADDPLQTGFTVSDIWWCGNDIIPDNQEHEQ